MKFVCPQICLVSLYLFTAVGDAAEFGSTKKQIHRASPYVTFHANIDLPLSSGYWEVAPSSDKSLSEIYLIPSRAIREQQLGRRVGAAIREMRLRKGRWHLSWVHAPAQAYAIANKGKGPKSFDDFDQEEFDHAIKMLRKSPLENDDQFSDNPLAGPYVFMLPRVEFHLAREGRKRHVPKEQRKLLAVELRPYLDDGKHWVQYTNGQIDREEIDEDLVRRFGLKITPVLKREESTTATKHLYQVVAVSTDPNIARTEISFSNSFEAARLNVGWELSTAQLEPANDVLLKARRNAWRRFVNTGPAPLLRDWGAAPGGTNRRLPRQELSAFSILGGRSAIEETLQLQVLNEASLAKNANKLIDVDTIRGVEVKAHPYEEMLKGKRGGQLALANVVPADRFFVYVAQPDSLLAFLDRGAEFIASTGAGITGNRLDYDLTNRYLKRLGLNRRLLESVLDLGLIQEMAVVAPDLFFIDGTELSVVSRLNRPAMVGGLLKLMGVRGEVGREVVAVKHKASTSYWTLRGDLLVIGTNREEVVQIVDLMEQQGEGSLGRSAEFRYMLTQLPVEDATRIFAYFSDPFVRKLVGPRVKLGQLRRVRARALLEKLTSRSLKAKLDGVKEYQSVATLKEADYLPADFPTRYAFSQDGVAHHPVYGSLARLEPLPRLPLEDVTPDEAESYHRYRENYSRYWRQFFDPIAIRLNDPKDGTLELTTFILPLIDSSIYNQLRATIHSHEDHVPLAVPQLKPTPILQFSANVKDESWRAYAKDFSRMAESYAGVSPAIIDDLGPGLHLAVFDADPVITFGSGDVMGAFGARSVGRGGDLMLPLAFSVFTRPCTILVETSNPERTAGYLRQAAASWNNNGNDDFRVSFYQEGEGDAWVWTFGVAGIVKMRFGVEVTDKYLVIRNIPWAVRDRITGVDKSNLASAKLTVKPSACRLQLPGLFAAAADQERRAAMSGLGRLYPLLLAGAADVESAGKLHAKLFGFEPLHPQRGAWIWEKGELRSSAYGDGGRQRQPKFDAKEPFGLMQAINTLDLSMQFEESGLRSEVTWRLRN